MEQETKEVKESLRNKRRVLEYRTKRLRLLNNRIRHSQLFSATFSIVVFCVLASFFFTDARFGLPLWSVILMLTIFLIGSGVGFIKKEYAEKDYFKEYLSAYELWKTLSDDVDWLMRRDFQTFNDTNENIEEVISDFYILSHLNASPIKKSLWYILCEIVSFIFLVINSALFAIIVYDLTTFVV